MTSSSSDSASRKTSSSVESKQDTTDVKRQDLPSPSDYLERSERKPITWNFFRIVATVVKIIFSLALVIALAVGYGLSIKVIDISVTSIGLYGTILVVDFIVQYSCAIANRWDVSRIVNRARQRNAQNSVEGTASPLSSEPLINGGAEVSIAVVGYREDEQAWKECLRSLQRQTLTPKCIVGVVDGNEEPDLDMAKSFMEEFSHRNSKLVHLPLLLSSLHRQTYFNTLAQFPDRRGRFRRWSDRFCGRRTEEEDMCLKIALDTVLKQVAEWEETFKISSYEAVCFSQPHGHKRTAMFTAFAMSLYAYKTRHAVFTTDSDTLLKEDALDEMLTLLQSSPDIGGVTADVKIFNRRESFLARLCSIRYWFAFNIERACQSFWRCVGCLSGPMALYRSHDLHTILGLWNLQTFRGKETTFGDDRHLSNQLLAQGFKTRYTHRTWCESESPTTFVRWTIQQSRWSKSFFREAFWFPHSFALQSWWMLVEITKQSLYPFILVATVFHMLYSTSTPFRPVIWICTMFGVAFVKSVLAFCMTLDPWLLLFTFYGAIYFFGLLPSKIYALLTMNKTTWGTSARSSTERRRGQSLSQQLFHVGHLVIWYMATAVGLGYFFSEVFDNYLFMLVSIVGVFPSLLLFVSIPSPSAAIKGWRKARAEKKQTKATTQSDPEKADTTMEEKTLTAKPSLRAQRPAPISVVSWSKAEKSDCNCKCGNCGTGTPRTASLAKLHYTYSSFSSFASSPTSSVPSTPRSAKLRAPTPPS